jgi:hypothetical protein
LLRIRSPLFQVGQLEAVPQQTVHIARHTSMVLHDTRRNPVGFTATLKKISIDWPDLRALRVTLPPRMPRGRIGLNLGSLSSGATEP